MPTSGGVTMRGSTAYFKLEPKGFAAGNRLDKILAQLDKRVSDRVASVADRYVQYFNETLPEVFDAVGIKSQTGNFTTSTKLYRSSGGKHAKGWLLRIQTKSPAAGVLETGRKAKYGKMSIKKTTGKGWTVVRGMKLYYVPLFAGPHPKGGIPGQNGIFLLRKVFKDGARDYMMAGRLRGAPKIGKGRNRNVSASKTKREKHARKLFNSYRKNLMSGKTMSDRTRAVFEPRYMVFSGFTEVPRTKWYSQAILKTYPFFRKAMNDEFRRLGSETRLT